MFARPTITLDPPPAYLRTVPTKHLVGPDYSADALLASLGRSGIVARPTLAEVEGERGRRGLRRRVVVSDVPASARVVLPMGDAAASGDPTEGRRNRDRVVAALGGESAVEFRDLGVPPSPDERRRRQRDPLARVASEIGARVA